jgi:hypothetical protein
MDPDRAAPHDERRPRAVVRLRFGPGRTCPMAEVDRDVRCDLGLVDDLLRLRVYATRLGWSAELTDVDPALRELFDLVGLTDQVEGPTR